MTDALTVAQLAAAGYAAQVSTEGRVLVDMYIGDTVYTRVTDIVMAAFLAGWEEGHAYAGKDRADRRDGAHGGSGADGQSGTDHHDSVAVADREPVGWYCACGWPNGINLAACAQCGRSPSAPDNSCTVIYRTGNQP